MSTGRSATQRRNEKEKEATQAANNHVKKVAGEEKRERQGKPR
jgi:hypothetical protein